MFQRAAFQTRQLVAQPGSFAGELRDRQLVEPTPPIKLATAFDPLFQVFEKQVIRGTFRRQLASTFSNASKEAGTKENPNISSKARGTLR